MTPRFFLGVDLGQAQDYTALAVLEQKMKMQSKPRPQGAEGFISPGDKLVSYYHLRQLERMPLNTPYTVVADHVYRTMQIPDLLGETALLVDATGVGRPVIDMMRVKKLSPIPIIIHGGYADPTQAEDGYHVPKRDLVSSLLILFQSQRIKIAPNMPFTAELESELQNFHVKVNDRARDSYGAWREGDHDDLVLAVAMAAWYANITEPWERQIERAKPKHRDWDPLARDDEEQEKPPFNPMRYGGHN